MTSNLFNKLSDNQISNINKIILDQINTPVEMLNNACAHLITSGGKRIRPRFAIIMAGLLDKTLVNDEAFARTAAAIELLHTATLLHDDVIDESQLRRGKPSTNNLFGNYVAVLGGDYLFAKVYTLALYNNKNILLNEFSRAVTTLVEGEISQMDNIADINLSEKEYFKVIYAKTSILFEVAAKLPGYILDIDDDKINLLAEYGIAIGNAFQIVDDVLDYTATEQTLGKDIGNDLEENKITLPLIYCLQSLDNEKDITEFKQAMKDKNIKLINDFIKKTNSIEKCLTKAKSMIGEAFQKLNIFNDNEYKDALLELNNLIINRDY